MLNTNKIPIPSRSQQQLMAAAETFTLDLNELIINDHNDHQDVNPFAFNIRWMLASRWEN